VLAFRSFSRNATEQPMAKEERWYSNETQVSQSLKHVQMQEVAEIETKIGSS